MSHRDPMFVRSFVWLLSQPEHRAKAAECDDTFSEIIAEAFRVYDLTPGRLAAQCGSEWTIAQIADWEIVMRLPAKERREAVFDALIALLSA